MTITGVECGNCHEPLAKNHLGPCPKCASAKRVKVEMNATSHVSASLRYLTTREYWKKHPVLLPIVLVLVLGSPFLGLVWPDWRGVLIGFALSVLSFVLGFFAVTRVRHDREGP
jgi:hypothetical protein